MFSAGHSEGLVLRIFAGAVISMILLVWPHPAVAQLPAFPGAEGEGMYTTGGRGGDVYHVTNLNDSGPGSFRYGLGSASGPRTVVFDVSGTIALNSDIGVYSPNITIAGQSAPGMGICLVNYGMLVCADNVIVRHIRVRPGDAKKGPDPGFYADALSLWGSHIVVDHCSTSWSIDELLSCAAGGFHDVSVQYCTISEGLDLTGLNHGQWEAEAFPPDGTDRHAMGSLIKPVSGDGVVSYHHNLWSQNYKRNPAIGSYTATQSVKADIRNNVMYNNLNNGYSSGDSLRVDINYVGNYVIAGSETSSTWLTKGFSASASNHCYLYQSGNKADGDRDTQRNGVDNGWSIFGGTYTKLTAPVNMRTVATQTADDAYNTVMASAGAFYWNRDSVDARLINNVQTMQGSIIDSQTEVGGYPVIPSTARPAGYDTDGDGMPNAWESWYGTNPTVADDPNGDRDSDGYKNLEEYLVWIYDPNSIHHAGDASGNDAVAFEDLSRLASNWSGTGKAWADGDYNGNGTVDFQDLSILSSNWGWQWAGAPPQEVPEPASLTLLAAGAIGTLLRRQRVAGSVNL